MNWEFENAEQNDDSRDFQAMSLDYMMNILNDSPQRKGTLEFTYHKTNLSVQKNSEENIQSQVENQGISEIQHQSLPDKKAEQQIIVSQKKIKEVSRNSLKKVGETLNLSKYIHQETVRYFKNLKLCKSLNREQQASFSIYKGLSSSLQNQLIFFSKHNTFKKRCLQLYNSADFIQNVLKSPKMFFKRKLMILKNINQFCQMIESQKIVNHWK